MLHFTRLGRSERAVRDSKTANITCKNKVVVDHKDRCIHIERE